ncbi:companion of reaper [Musca autumnalis]|uniref:companion of reaper n=1 Tax=Musca autumnalis TaxID=221902 RepID=UPI003CF1074F
MIFKNSLKVSYKGLTRNIECDTVLPYEDVVSKVIETFDLTHIQRNAIQLYDEHGAKYDKEIFEYFILLFPNPQKLFFVRLDASLLLTLPSQANQMRSTEDSTTIEPRQPFKVSKKSNKLKETTNTHTEAVPVRRQNCFIGQWPGTTTTNVDNQQQDMVRGIVNRYKMFHDSTQHNKLKTTTTTASVVKRSIRI